MSKIELAARPEWMDDDLLKTCVLNSKNLPKDIDLQIDHVDVNYAVPKGENYMSIVYRVKVDSSILKDGQSNGNSAAGGQTSYLIVKLGLEVSDMKDMIKDMNVFDKERDMYVDMLPKLNMNLKAAGLEPINTCRYVHSELGDRDLLILEDMTFHGYVSINRMKGLNLQESKLVLEQLAKMHASSMQYFRQFPDLLPARYRDSPYKPNKSLDNYEEIKKMTEDGLRENCTKIIEYLTPDPKYKNAIKFFKWAQHFDTELAAETWDKMEGNIFNGLTQGDCWTNNILFKYGHNQVIESVILLDHQMGFFSSVIGDFIYFFFTSPNNDTKRCHMKTLKKFYLDTLTFTLTKLGYIGDIPTMEDFDKELKRLRWTVAYMLTCFNPIITRTMNEKQKDRSESEAFSLSEVFGLSTQLSAEYFGTLLASVEALEEIDGFLDV